MYHIAICDDDINYIHYIEKMIYKTGISKNKCEFYEYTSGVTFMKEIEKITAIDLLILDIQLPETDGNQVAKHFRTHFPLSTLVFCSGVYLPTVKSFEPNPFRYLLKSYTDIKMINELKIILHEMKNRRIEPYLIGSWYHDMIKLKPSEILYISIGRNCSVIHASPNADTKGFENITIKEKLSDLYTLLKDFDFEYAHNSYIVNLKYIKRTSFTELELVDGTILTISRSKEKDFHLAFLKYAAKKY